MSAREREKRYRVSISLFFCKICCKAGKERGFADLRVLDIDFLQRMRYSFKRRKVYFAFLLESFFTINPFVFPIDIHKKNKKLGACQVGQVCDYRR